MQRTFLFNRRACQGARPTYVRRHVVFYYLLHQPTRQDRVWGLALAVVSCLSCSEASFTGIVNVQSFVDRRKRGACGVSAPHDEVLSTFAQDRLFCFGKRTQNHGRPGVALRGPLPRSRLLGLRNSLRSDSPRPQLGFGTVAQPRPQAP